MTDARDLLAPNARLALAYTPRAQRPAVLALLALDARLADLVRGAREVILGQMRLAWWRDTLAKGPEAWRNGDPVLTAIRDWPLDRAALLALIDGWEHLLDPAPLAPDRIADFVAGRAAPWAALGAAPGERMGRRWALADLAAHCSDPTERDLIAGTTRAPPEPLPRALRGLAMLAGGRAEDGTSRPLRALRLGLLGR